MGKLYGGGFQAILEYFQQKTCRFCTRPYTSDGIEPLREEPGVLVVRVRCTNCSKPLGVAIVGMGPQGQKQREKYSPEWTKRDSDRFNGKPPISYDDVLNAHQFFDGLGPDWARHLPKYGRAAGS